MTLRARELHHEPVTPMVDGKPPGFVVLCLDCGYAADVHGPTAEDAVTAASNNHQAGHRLIARAVDNTKHPLYTS